MSQILATERSHIQNFSREFVFIVFYNKNTILMVWACFFAFSLLLALLLPPVYSSSAKFIVSAGGNQLDPLQQERDYDLKNKMVRALQNQKEIIYSSTVLEKVAKVINPDASSKEQEDIVTRLRRDVKFTPPKGESFEGSNVFYITYEDKDPKQTMEVAKTLAETYLATSGSFSQGKAEYSYDFFRKQVEQLHDEMQRKGVKLREFETTYAAELIDILNLESGKTTQEVGPRAMLTEATRTKTRLQQEAVTIQMELDTLEKGLKESAMPLLLPSMEVSGRAIAVYRNKVAQLQLQINELSTQYTPEYEPRKVLAKELALTTELLRTEVQSYIKSRRMELSGLETKIADTDNQIAQYESSIAATAQQRSTYEALKQEYAIASRAYQDAVAKMDQARMASALKQDVQNLTYVEAPQLPFKPVKPNRFLLVLLGCFGGLLFGVALAMVRDFFDHTIKSVEDIERWLELPAVGSVNRINT